MRLQGKHELQKGETKMDEREKLGKLGEKRACLYLQRCGYRIVERNFRRRSREKLILLP